MTKRFENNMRFKCPKCGADSTGGYTYKFGLFPIDDLEQTFAERIKLTCNYCGYKEFFPCVDSTEKEN